MTNYRARLEPLFWIGIFLLALAAVFLFKFPTVDIRTCLGLVASGSALAFIGGGGYYT